MRPLNRLGVVSVLLLALAPSAGIRADIIKLKSGREVRGQIVRTDQQQVIVSVAGQPAFFSREEIESITREHLGLATPPPAAPAHETPSAVELKLEAWHEALLQKLRERVRVFREVLSAGWQALQALRHDTPRAALARVRHATHHSLPLRRGEFDPLAALADLLILLGLRAPLLWLGFLLAREKQSFTRIAEFLLPAYGLTVALLSFGLTIASPVAGLGLLLATAVAVTALFFWMFQARPAKALLACGITVVVTLALEHLLNV